MIGALLAAVLTATAPTVAFTITDPRIIEASGIAPGIRSPGVVYVQNDSGDTNRIFAVSTRTGRTLATLTVPGAENVDWEDLAVARDAAGVPSIWIADTGNNSGARREAEVYRVPEPRIDTGADDEAVTTARPAVWRFRPQGNDIESLAVAPGGRAFLVSKALLGNSTVYELPSKPDADRVRDLSAVASIKFDATGTPGGPSELAGLGQVTATGAAFSADGTIFAARTYTDAYVWRVGDAGLAAALRTQPAHVALPNQPQGEGIAVSGGRLLIDSEGKRQPVYSVPLPAIPSAAGATTSRPASSAASSAPSSAPSSARSSAPAEPDEGDRSGSDNTRYVVGGAVVIVLGLAVVAFARRRR